MILSSHDGGQGLGFWRLFKRPSQKPGDEIALRFIVGDKVRDLTVKELCVTNKLSIEALVSLLVRKGVIKPQELLDEINKVSKESFKVHQPPDSKASDDQHDQS